MVGGNLLNVALNYQPKGKSGPGHTNPSQDTMKGIYFTDYLAVQPSVIIYAGQIPEWEHDRDGVAHRDVSLCVALYRQTMPCPRIAWKST
jgi:hypothetical protein